jgi:hypothetical protein
MPVTKLTETHYYKHRIKQSHFDKSAEDSLLFKFDDDRILSLTTIEANNLRNVLILQLTNEKTNNTIDRLCNNIGHIVRGLQNAS